MNSDEQNPKDSVEVITPPHSIKDKVGRGGRPSKDMLAKAEAAISKMSEDYPEWAMNDVDRLEALVQGTKPATGNGRVVMEDAFKLAHDMRGQGGSFGYPLMTRISNSFCRFVEELEAVDEAAVQICKAHVQSMRAVLSNKVKGNGGSIGAQIAEGLEAAVNRYKENQENS